MSREAMLVELAKKAVEQAKIVIAAEVNDNVFTEVTSNKEGNTVIFTLTNGRTVEYSISEISDIFEDVLEGFEIFSKNKYRDIYRELRGVELEVLAL